MSKPFVFMKTNKAVLSDNDVVEYWNFNESANFQESVSQTNIVKGWTGITIGMIMADDHSCRVGKAGKADNVTRMHETGVHCPAK